MRFLGRFLILLAVAGPVNAYLTFQSLVQCNPQKPMVAFSNPEDGQGVELMDLNTGKTIAHIGKGPISALTFSLDGRYLALSQRGVSLKIAKLDHSKPELVSNFEIPYWPTAMSFLGENTLLVGSLDGRLRVLDIGKHKTSELLPVYNCQTTWVGTMGDEILALHSDGWLRRWDLKTLMYRGRTRLLDRAQGAHLSAAILTAVGRTDCIRYNVLDGSKSSFEVPEVRFPKPFRAFSSSPDGRTLALDTGQYVVQILDSKGKLIAKFPQSDFVSDLSFASDAHLVVALSKTTKEFIKNSKGKWQQK